MFNKISIIILCVFLISCNIKPFSNNDQVNIVNTLNMRIHCSIKLKNLKTKFSFQQGFYYEENGVKYYLISNFSNILITHNNFAKLMIMEKK